MLGDLKDQALIANSDFDLKGVKNLRKLLIELNIDDGSDDLGHLTRAVSTDAP
jgi:hypothetical protein